MIYYDNAATSFPKPREVTRELLRCVTEYCGNPGRSGHLLSRRASEEVYSAREAIARLLNVSTPESVVFTYNATYALNIAIKAFITPGCHVIVSDMEHNAVIRPLEHLKRTEAITYSCFSTDGDIYQNIKSLIKKETRGIISSIASNVTGKSIDLGKLSEIARENGIYLIIDASQALGHYEIDLSKTPCDVLCAPTHKGIFGIQGCGFAVFSDIRRRECLIEGGSGIDSINAEMPIYLPEGYEAGTLGTPAIVTAAAGAEFVYSQGVDSISAHIRSLSDMLAERILSIRHTKLYGYDNGILSFNLGSRPSSAVAAALDEHGICVRGGLHCAPSAHKKLGTTSQGTVRISLSVFNTEEQLDEFYKALYEISNM